MSRGEAGWQIGGASARGAMHERRDQPNQDAVAWLPTDGAGRQVVLAVADGHGASAHYHSGTGARLAVQCAGTVLDWFLSDDHSSTAAAELPQQLVQAWQGAVMQHAAAEASGAAGWVEPMADTLLPYGTTLLAFAASSAVAVALQIGDGDLFLGYPDGRIGKPLADDTELVGEQTYSLCGSDAPVRFRTALLRQDTADAPDFAFLATDGIAKSFGDDAALLGVVGHYRQVLLRSSVAEVLRPLPAWLQELSRRGSGDDATLGLAIRRPN